MTVAEALELGELLEGQESNFALRLMTDIAWVLSDRLTDAMIIESQKKGRGKR
ncbi:MAG: hypothetical protein Q7S02_03860 [bacterium]|nr:hypothetical protein [bacterium]